jgi:Short C-terminal domain
MPMFRRRPLLRAAAVGGGAYALGKHTQRAQEDREQAAYDQGAQQSMAPAPAPAAPQSSGITSEDTQRLEELGRLHDQGVLTDEEFSAQKARILGMT